MGCGMGQGAPGAGSFGEADEKKASKDGTQTSNGDAASASRASAAAASGEEQAALQQAEVALQTQLLQQQQFQIEMRNFEASRGNGSATRFKEGYRPLQMCRGLKQFGACRRGEGCTFGHALHELHPASADLQDGGSTGAVPSALAEQDAANYLNGTPQMQMKKKRDICQRMSKSGCLLNEKCMFAHSETELGTVALVITDERVKRILCRFWESGRCGYGKYCVNAHGMEEIGKLKPPEELCPAGGRRN